MGITIKDIAERAGVSFSTVSKALNDSPLVQEKTKQRILKIANEMGYQPNIMAKNLVSKKSKTIGVVWPTIERAAHSAIATKINEEIEKASYSMILSINPVDAAISLFQRFQVDGVLVFEENGNKAQHLYSDNDIPILFYGVSGDKATPTIDINRRQAVYKAVEYLHRLNHKKIVYIGDLSHRDSRQIEKYIGFTEACYKHGIPITPEMLVNVDGLDWYDGYVATKKLFESMYKPTAIIGGSYDITLGIVRAAQEYRLSIPETLSVIGYDNIPQMNTFEPPLTAVGAPVDKIAKTIVRTLLQLIDDLGSSTSVYEVEAELTERASCQSI